MLDFISQFLTTLVQFLTTLGSKSPAFFAMCLTLVVGSAFSALPCIDVRDLPLNFRQRPNAKDWRACVNAITVRISVPIPFPRATCNGLVMDSSFEREFKLSSAVELLKQGSANLNRAYAKARRWFDGYCQSIAALTWTTQLCVRTCCRMSRVHIAPVGLDTANIKVALCNISDAFQCIHLRQGLSSSFCELKRLFHPRFSSVRFRRRATRFVETHNPSCWRSRPFSFAQIRRNFP